MSAEPRNVYERAILEFYQERSFDEANDYQSGYCNLAREVFLISHEIELKPYGLRMMFARHLLVKFPYPFREDHERR